MEKSLQKACLIVGRLTLIFIEGVDESVKRCTKNHTTIGYVHGVYRYTKSPKDKKKKIQVKYAGDEMRSILKVLPIVTER